MSSAARRFLRELPGARPAVRRMRRFGKLVRLAPLYVPKRPTGTPSDLIVSLTSFPPRIPWVWMTIESLLRQTVRPRKILLVLSEEEFPSRRLPARLTRLEKRGLEILWTSDNLRSYKKLVPVRNLYPEATVVTVDDDVIYHPCMLERLVSTHDHHPGSIIGHRGWELTVADGRLDSYASLAPARPATGSVETLLTGVGGILYPSSSLPERLLADTDLAASLCPDADDIWLWALARVAGTATFCTGLGEEMYRPNVLVGSWPRLGVDNVIHGGNDHFIQAVVDHFGLQESLGLNESSDL